MDLLVALDLYWDDGRLWVSADFENDDIVITTLSSSHTYLFKWQGFSETRWGKACSSARLFLRGLTSGMDGLYDMVKNDAAVSMYDLHGYERATPEVRKYFVAVAFGGYPAESLVMELFEDDAWLRRSEELRDTVSSEIAYVKQLVPYV